MDALNCPECGRKPKVAECFGDYFILCEGAPSDCFCSLHEAPFGCSHFPFFASKEECIEAWNADVDAYE